MRIYYFVDANIWLGVSQPAWNGFVPFTFEYPTVRRQRENSDGTPV
jgi:hypothetical protein